VVEVAKFCKISHFEVKIDGTELVWSTRITRPRRSVGWNPSLLVIQNWQNKALNAFQLVGNVVFAALNAREQRGDLWKSYLQYAHRECAPPDCKKYKVIWPTMSHLLLLHSVSFSGLLWVVISRKPHVYVLCVSIVAVAQVWTSFRSTDSNDINFEGPKWVTENTVSM